MSNIHDVVVELSKLTVRALRELGNAGPEARERACQLAGQAWALLHREHPDAAERMNGVLHFLTGPRFAGPTPVAFESVSPAMAGVVVEEGDTSAAQSIADAFLRTGDASA